MHLLKAVFSLAALLASASSTQYCECRGDGYHNINGFDYVFKYINNGCALISNDWCSTNCNGIGKLCRYCQYKPAGDADTQSTDYKELDKWCGAQRKTSLRGNSYYGKLHCWPRSRIRECWECGGCSYYDNSIEKGLETVMLQVQSSREVLITDDDAAVKVFIS